MKAHFEQLNPGPALPDMQVLQGQSTQGNPMTDSPIAMEEVEVGNFTAQTTQSRNLDGMAAFLKLLDSFLFLQGIFNQVLTSYFGIGAIKRGEKLDPSNN